MFSCGRYHVQAFLCGQAFAISHLETDESLPGIRRFVVVSLLLIYC
ncbi:MAG: hypothetical protein ACR5K7_03510 [Symbiopectobacterium sp.]